VMVTATNQAPMVNAGVDQTITLPNRATLTGTASDDGLPTNSLSLSWSAVTAPATVIFSQASDQATEVIFSTPGVYTLRLTANDSQLMSSDEIVVTVNADPTPPPPDPVTVAPPLDITVVNTIGAATEFLYTGANPIQTGVAPGTIKPMRAAVLRGRVLDKNGAALPLVKITVLNHPEYGQTMSRADGRFDMAVNGGGLLTVNYEKGGFLPLQRCEDVPWQDYCGVPDVVMMSYDPAVSFIDLNSTAPIQVAQSTTSTDSSGSRRTTFFFKQGTTATMKLPGGAMQGLDKLDVRATEFTVGANGPNAMPGELPALSAYTYAAAYTIDEAVAANALEVTFNQPVVQYNENFLNFPVGTSVPSGAYDKQQGIWMPSANGRIVKILSITSGLVNLDVNGNAIPATDPEYAALGINTAERQQLAALFSVGQSLWRVPVIHFSFWDSNFGFGAPTGGGQSNGGPATSGGGAPAGSGGQNGCTECHGSILGVEDQRLSEELDLVGTPFFLRYDSTRPRGRVSDYTARIPLSGATLVGPVKRIEMTVSIAGQSHFFSFPAQANQITSFTWDGKDAYGRDVQGQQEALIDISNVYDGVYQNVANFGYNGNGVPITVNTRQEINIHRLQRLQLGTYSAPPQTLGGWTLSEHHAYDPVGQKLYEGNGKQRDVQTVSNVINTFAGGLSGFAGDGGPVSEARFLRPFGIATGPDGSVYVADSANQRVRRIAPDGTVSTFAGDGNGCNPFNFPCGDGGPATSASIGGIIRVAVGPDNSIYIGGGRNLWRVTLDGIIHRVAGIISSGFSGDGGQARNAQLSDNTRFYPASDGSVYLSDQINQRIRRIDPNGIITTIAGTGTAGFSGDGGPATQAQITYPGDLVVAPDGNVYFVDQFPSNRIRRISTDGIITTVAGNGVYANSGDGGPALLASFAFTPFNPIINGVMSLASDGSLYVISYSGAGGHIRRIGTDGIVTAVAGNGQLGSQGDGGPALAAQMRLIAFGLAPDGSIYTVGGELDFDESRIRRISSPLPGFTNNQIAIPSEDGAQLFRFDAAGRHLNTVNTLTGATIYTFAYDSAGRLTTVTDGDNNITTIERNGSGNPTGILSPYNQLTTFTLNANGYFATITNPASEQYQFTYNAGGQMTSETDPRNNQNTFTYNALGQLIRDDDPATGFQTLTRTGQDSDFTVTRNTALNQTSAFQVQQLANGDRQRTSTLPSGLQEILIERQNGTSTLTTPDGTVTNETLGPDPRWRMQAPMTTNLTVTTPGNLVYNSSFARSVTLSNPADPLSLTNQTSTLNINGRIYTSVFTAATRTFANNSPAGRQKTMVIDGQGRATQWQFANLDAANYTYNAQGRLATATFGSGGTARLFTHGYNAGGFLSSITDPLNRVVGFSRDNAGRLTQQTLPDARVISYGYNANGNLTAVTPPGRPAHLFAYNNVDLLSSYTPPAVSGTGATQFVYNLDRQLTTITRPDSLTLNFAYDAAGRLQTLTLPNGVYTYGYSATTGNLTSIGAPDSQTLNYSYDGSLLKQTVWGGGIVGSVSRTFDNDFRVASQSVNGGNTINFTYDNDNLLSGAGSLTITRNAQNGLMTGTTLGSVTDTRGYNGFGELTNYSASFNATELFSVTNTRDKLGRITQKAETIGGVPNTYDYTYDAAGQLIEVKLNSVTTSTYVYDSNDNRASLTTSGGTVTGTYDNQDRLTQYGTTTYVYTANGELSSKTTGAQTTTYNYDVAGNLRQVTLPGGAQVEYLIDGQNRRIGKKVNGTLTQGWLYQNQLKPVAELDGSNNLVSRFVYGSRTNVPDYMIKAGVTYRLITDHLGSVRLVVNNSTGAIAQRLDYDEFGVVTMDTSPGFQPFGFAGGLYDSQTGLLRFGARDYDAEIGRWTAKDPILFAGNGTNLYAYVRNNPINAIDQSGLQAENDGQSYAQAREVYYLQRQIYELNQQLGSLQAELAQANIPTEEEADLMKKIADNDRLIARLRKCGAREDTIKRLQDQGDAWRQELKKLAKERLERAAEIQKKINAISAHIEALQGQLQQIAQPRPQQPQQPPVGDSGF
jgi:RHS repeat-associated protein